MTSSPGGPGRRLNLFRVRSGSQVAEGDIVRHSFVIPYGFLKKNRDSPPQFRQIQTPKIDAVQ